VLRSKLEHLSVEEFANTITHGFGLLLSVIGFIVLIALAVSHGGTMTIVSSVVYGVSLIVLYAASTAYHSTASIDLKRRLQIVDHCCIYLLIAGSYTPFALVIFEDTLGKNLLILIWIFAAVGVGLKLLLRNRFTVLSVVSYLVMGWIGAAGVRPLFESLGFAATALAVTGGLAYTLGVVFFAWQRLPHNHAIFHVFVLTGSVLHYLAVVIYVVPAG